MKPARSFSKLRDSISSDSIAPHDQVASNGPIRRRAMGGHVRSLDKCARQTRRLGPYSRPQDKSPVEVESQLSIMTDLWLGKNLENLTEDNLDKLLLHLTTLAKQVKCEKERRKPKHVIQHSHKGQDKNQKTLSPIKVEASGREREMRFGQFPEIEPITKIPEVVIDFGKLQLSAT